MRENKTQSVATSTLIEPSLYIKKKHLFKWKIKRTHTSSYIAAYIHYTHTHNQLSFPFFFIYIYTRIYIYLSQRSQTSIHICHTHNVNEAKKRPEWVGGYAGTFLKSSRPLQIPKQSRYRIEWRNLRCRRHEASKRA